MMCVQWCNPSHKTIWTIRKSFGPPHNLVLTSQTRWAEPVITNLFPEILVMKPIMAFKIFACGYFNFHSQLTYRESEAAFGIFHTFRPDPATSPTVPLKKELLLVQQVSHTPAPSADPVPLFISLPLKFYKAPGPLTRIHYKRQPTIRNCTTSGETIKAGLYETNTQFVKHFMREDIKFREPGKPAAGQARVLRDIPYQKRQLTTDTWDEHG